jgi:hypothetical protein
MPAPNINFKRESLYLLIDEKTDGILCATDSIDAATAMCIFSLRITVQALETHMYWLREGLRKIDYRDATRHYAFKIGDLSRNVVPLEDPTNEFLEFKKEVTLRVRFQERLRVYCDGSIAAHSSEAPMLEDYSSTIIYELGKCDPANDKFTDAIKAYADINEISEKVAYQELKLHIDNLSTVRMLNYAMYMKFRALFNNAPATNEAQMAVLSKLFAEIYKGVQK